MYTDVPVPVFTRVFQQQVAWWCSTSVRCPSNKNEHLLVFFLHCPSKKRADARSGRTHWVSVCFSVPPRTGFCCKCFPLTEKVSTGYPFAIAITIFGGFAAGIWDVGKLFPKRGCRGAFGGRGCGQLPGVGCRRLVWARCPLGKVVFDRFGTKNEHLLVFWVQKVAFWGQKPLF